MKQRSAKDIAFEKERQKFRSEIRELERLLNDKQKEIIKLNEVIREKDNTIIQQKEWIERLLEYTEMSKEDLEMLINNEKDKAEIREKISSVLPVIGIIGGRMNGR